jgi:succinate dehydrogenase/fumarate reductase cytochrome b subunit
MLLDLWANAKAAEGPAAFERAIGWTIRLPTAAMAALAIPLALHAAVGIGLAIRSVGSIAGSAKPSTRYALQRITGAVSLIYVTARVVRFWLPLRAAGGSPNDVRAEWLRLASSTWNGMPLLAYVWLLALAACTFHLGHGLFLAAVRWGLTPTRRRRAGAMTFGAVLGVGAFLLGAHGVLRLATGWSPFPVSSAEPGGTCAPDGGAGR